MLVTAGVWQWCNSVVVANSLRTGKPQFDSRQGQMFLITIASKPAMEPTRHRRFFHGGKALPAWSWPLISVSCRSSECLKTYLPPPHIFMPVHGDTFTFVNVCSLTCFRAIDCISVSTCYKLAGTAECHLAGLTNIKRNIETNRKTNEIISVHLFYYY